MSKLKVGIIGVGGIAATHLPGWEASEDADLVAGSDIDPKTLKRWAERNGIERTSTNPADLFADPDIDIIDICTPNNYHAPLAIAAMKAGKHVICEKPLAPTPAQIRKMIQARDRAGVLLMTAQSTRFSGASMALRAEVETGVLGDVYHSRAWMIRRAAAPVRPGFIMKKHSGGGPCIDIGVHILDLALWMMGNPRPVAVTGVANAHLAHQKGAFSVWGGEIPKELDVEDFAAAFVRFENGGSLILEVSWLLHHDVGEDVGNTDSQLWLYGTKAGAHWPKCEIYETNYKTRQHYNRKLKTTDSSMRAHARECVEFARAVATGGPSPVPAEQALQVMAILDGIYRSQEKGGEVRLKL